MIRKLCVPTVLTTIALALVACSGGKIPAGQLPDIAGPWEFLAVSNNQTTVSTGIEVALKAGQSFVNGVEQPNGQVSATGATQIAILSINGTSGAVAFGGNCPLSGTGTYDLEGSFSSAGGPFTFTYTENGNVFNVSATLSADGKSAIGTYSSAAGSNCTDSGGITGTAVPKLSGAFVGKLSLPDGTKDAVTATLSEDSSSNLTVSLVATSPDSVSFTLTGPATGNAFAVQGTFQGQQVAYEGYVEQVVNPSTQAVTLAVYFVNATVATQPAYAGTLTPQPNQN